MLNQDIQPTLLSAAENTVSNFLLEMGAEKDNNKIMEFSFILNAFISYLEDFRIKLENAKNNEEILNIAKDIYAILQRDEKSVENFEDYPEHIPAAYQLAIEECKEALDFFKEEEYHKNLVLHFLIILPLQNINNGVH